MLGMVGSALCCILCKGSILFFDKVGKAKFEQHMQFEHGAAFNLEFMLAACKMNDAERKALVEVFDPKRGNPTLPENSGVSGKVKDKDVQNQKKSIDSELVKCAVKTSAQDLSAMNVKNVSRDDKTIVATKEPHTPKKRDTSAPKTPRKREPSVSSEMKNEPKTPGKRQQSASQPKNREPKTPGKRDRSTPNIRSQDKREGITEPTTPTCIVTEPETPMKRTSSVGMKEPGTPNKKELTASSSFGTEPKTPKKREPSASKKELKTPSKREPKTPLQMDLLNGNNTEPKTPGKVGRPKTPSRRELSVNREEPKTPTKATAPKTPAKAAPPKTPAKAKQPKTPAKAKQPKTPAKVTQPKTPSKATLPKITTKNTQPKTPAKAAPPKTPAKATQPKTPAKKRESSVSNLNTKESKKARHEEFAHKDEAMINLDSDSESVIFVNDSSLTPCKICPLTFSYKKEYREHLKKHKKETSAKIENTKKEIEDLKLNLKPKKFQNRDSPKNVDFQITIPSNVLSATKAGKKATTEEMKRLLKKEINTKSFDKKSPQIAAKDNRWQCGLSNGAGRCKETFDIRRGLRYHMANDHGKTRESGC